MYNVYITSILTIQVGLLYVLLTTEIFKSYVVVMFVVSKTHVMNLRGLLIPPRILFTNICF